MNNSELKYLKPLQEVIDTDWSAEPITDETKRQSVLVAQSGRFPTDVRITTGRVYTDKEYSEMRKRVLSTPLP